jgi:hypothetical protein
MSPTEKEHHSPFDAMAEGFDAWFAKKANVFESGLLAEKHFLTDPENTVSIGAEPGCSRKGTAFPAVWSPRKGWSGWRDGGGTLNARRCGHGTEMFRC